jgi:hypothetical protein
LSRGVKLRAASGLPRVPGGLALAKQPTKWEETMLRPITVAFALALASSAQAMPIALLQQPDDMVVKVREAARVFIA